MWRNSNESIIKTTSHSLGGCSQKIDSSKCCKKCGEVKILKTVLVEL
jgi:hypothetical protein